MYIESERNDILNRITADLRNREEVLSVILVGSGAVGFRDKLSDLDLAVLIDGSADINSVFAKTKEDVSSICNIVTGLDMPGNNLQVFLLENYLEIDVGYYTSDTLYARRKNYKVVFDITGMAEKLMSDSWEKMKDINRGTAGTDDMKRLIEYIDSELWYNVIHCVSAFCRNNRYRCFYELNDIRNFAIDLTAKRNNVESKKHRDIELLGDEDKARIDELFIYPKSNAELKDTLIKAIDLIYENLDHFKVTEGAKYTISKEFLIRYAEENL